MQLHPHQLQSKHAMWMWWNWILRKFMKGTPCSILMKYLIMPTAVKGIKSIHHMKTRNSAVLTYATTTDGNKINQSSNSSGSESLNVSLWCVVEYDKELFPGEIKAVVGDKYQVSVMVKAGKYWKWPAQADKLLCCQDQIVKALNPPVLINFREHYNFPAFTIKPWTAMTRLCFFIKHLLDI